MNYLQYHKYLFCFIKSQKCMNFIKIINVPVTSWWQKENFLRECCRDHFKEMANLIKSLSINLKVFFTFFLCYAKITFFIPLHRLLIWNNFFLLISMSWTVLESHEFTNTCMYNFIWTHATMFWLISSRTQIILCCANIIYNKQCCMVNNQTPFLFISHSGQTQVE